VARARLLALVLDASEDPEGAEATLRAELHAARLSEKPAIVVLNKVDLIDEELRQYLREIFPNAAQVSAVTGEGVEELRDLLEDQTRALEEEKSVAGEASRKHRVFRPAWKGLRVESANGGYAVYGEEAELVVMKTDWDSLEGAEHGWRELEKRGVVTALRRAGARPGDEVRIGEMEFDFR
jgi:GTP-binding protein